MNAEITLVWQLSVVFLALAALLQAPQWFDAIRATLAAEWNKLMNALLELGD